MTLTLPPQLASRQDIARLRTEVERYQAWSRQYQNAARRDIQYQSEQPALSDTASSLIRAWVHDKKSIDQLVSEIETIRKSAPSMTVTLASPPPASVQQQLVGWIRTHIGESMLVEFRWNSRLIGGMIIQTDTAMFDWSHRRLLMSSRDKLAQRLQNV